LFFLYRKTKSRQIFNELGKYILRMTVNNLRRPCFSKYVGPHRDEMISDAVFLCSKKLNTYDPSINPQPFSYFTTVIYRGFLQRIKDNKKRAQIMKPIDYIDKLEEKAFEKSTLFKGGPTE